MIRLPFGFTLANDGTTVVEVYKKDVDRTLLDTNLKLTPAQRAEKFVDFMNFLGEIQRAGRKLRGEGE